jgi:putative Mg2+ transporter-C (MgtC) family protein
MLGSGKEAGMELELSDVALRLGAAAFAGAMIGLNRDLAQKPIGMRTLGLVALGAATVTVATTTVPGMVENKDAMSRVVQGVIQGIMAGISFIGAGVILRDARTRTVEGLTTAASVWVTAAVGIACGLGAWSVVLIGTAIALALLVLVGRFETFYDSKPQANSSQPQSSDARGDEAEARAGGAVLQRTP